MQDEYVRIYNCFKQMQQWAIDHAAGIVPGSVLELKFAALSVVIAAIESASGILSGAVGGASAQFTVKKTGRENLRSQIQRMATTAISINYDHPGFEDRYQFRGNLSGADLLATARAFVVAATGPDKDLFIAYELPKTFLDDLTAAADTFEASIGPAASGLENRVASGAELGAHFRQGMIIKRTLDAPIKNRFADDIGALAAWHTASHIARAPKKVTPPTPPTP